MSTATINISLPDTMKSDVEAVLVAEGYGNTSEFFRDLVRDYLRKRQIRKLEELVLEGLRSPASPLTKADFVDIKNILTEKFLARQAQKK